MSLTRKLVLEMETREITTTKLFTLLQVFITTPRIETKRDQLNKEKSQIIFKTNLLNSDKSQRKIS